MESEAKKEKNERSSTGGLPSLAHDKDGCGFLRVDDSQYATVISHAVEPLVTWHGVVA